MFNVGDRALENIRVSWAQIGLPSSCVVRDLWAHNDVGKLTDGNAFQVPPHGSGLFKMTPAK